MIAIECEFLLGVSFAARWGEDKSEHQWPPHPATLHAALVNGWGDGGEQADERSSILTLEGAAPPDVLAPDVNARDVVSTFVPANDMDVSGKPGAPLPGKDTLKRSLSVLPLLRSVRQPVSFPAAALPDDGRTVWFVWPDVLLDVAERAALNRLLSRVAYLGHSASLVRLLAHDRHDKPHGAWAEWKPEARGDRFLRTAGAGRMYQLELLHARGLRPTIGTQTRYASAERVRESAASSLFGGDWIVMAGVSRRAPTLDSCAMLAWAVRRKLVAMIDDPDQFAGHLNDHERGTVRSAITGRELDGSVSSRPHVAIVPMADVGWSRSGGALFGIAFVLPRELPEQELVRDVLASADTIATGNGSDGRAGFIIDLGAFGEWTLARAEYDERQSLRPLRYLAESTLWTTATPIVLDRFPKRQEDVGSIVERACQHAGLPAPTALAVHEWPTVVGSSQARARDRRSSRGWITRWPEQGDSQRRALGSHPIVHATIEFSTPVRGPVILGRGRYYGLGLLLPLGEERSE